LREALVNRRPLIDLEKEEIGIPHTLVGKLLLQKWKLPPSLADAVQSHHKPRSNDGGESAKMDISLIIMIADTLSKIACIGSGGDTHVYTADQDILGSLPLGEGAMSRSLRICQNTSKTLRGSLE
jgi:HD-like signal output (HDOD) protein